MEMESSDGGKSEREWGRFRSFFQVARGLFPVTIPPNDVKHHTMECLTAHCKSEDPMTRH